MFQLVLNPNFINTQISPFKFTRLTNTLSISSENKVWTVKDGGMIRIFAIDSNPYIILVKSSIIYCYNENHKNWENINPLGYKYLYHNQLGVFLDAKESIVCIKGYTKNKFNPKIIRDKRIVFQTSNNKNLCFQSENGHASIILEHDNEHMVYSEKLGSVENQMATSSYKGKDYIHILGYRWSTYDMNGTSNDDFAIPLVLYKKDHYILTDSNQRLDTRYLNITEMTHFTGEYFYMGDRVFGPLTTYNVQFLSKPMYNYVYFIMLCWNQVKPNGKLKDYIPRIILFEYIIKPTLFDVNFNFSMFQ